MKIKRGQLDLNRANRIKLVALVVLVILVYKVGQMVQVVIEGERYTKENKISCTIWDGR